MRQKGKSNQSIFDAYCRYYCPFKQGIVFLARQRIFLEYFPPYFPINFSPACTPPLKKLQAILAINQQLGGAVMVRQSTQHTIAA